MSLFTEHSVVHNLQWQVGLETDIGGGRENQDDCFVWIKRDDNVIVLCVLDGHGREVGKIASESAKACLFKHLDENYKGLLQTPEEFLVNAHNIAHDHIRECFRNELTKQGYEVITAENGFLMKRRQATDCWSCVHGGTSCSLAAVVGDQLFVANVGDSTGILCSSFNVLGTADLSYVQDAAVPEEFNRISMLQAQTRSTGIESPASLGTKSETDIGTNKHSNCSIHSEPSSSSKGCSNRDNNSYKSNNNSNDNSNTSFSTTLVITSEHSPECPYEYSRLLRFRARDGNADLPALVVVYDSSTSDKTRCAPVFERNGAGVPCVTSKGSYYKNVRKEWASLVSTPPYAQFQDALAFTRSLGDLHLHTYGVTHLPEVQRIDLRAVFDRLEQQVASSSAATAALPGLEGLNAEAVAQSTLCLVLATDGVWDNWTYEDVTRFVMDPSCLGAVGAATDGAKRVTISFMQRNALYAKRNFGNNADNATAIVLYLSAQSGMPCV